MASNATGQSEFHPLYFSPGNVKNSVRRAHRDALVPIGFLAIPKSIFYPRAPNIFSQNLQAPKKTEPVHYFGRFGGNSCTSP